MSFTRRLQRVLRAHLGRWRDDPLDEPMGAPAGDPDDASSAAASSDAAQAARADVPPDVAEAYRALEVPVGSDRKTVKKGYRRMMKKYHQDRFQNDEEKREIAGTVSKRLNRAYKRVNAHLDDISD
jgi:DnaJ-domain-containing protein 1